MDALVLRAFLEPDGEDLAYTVVASVAPTKRSANPEGRYKWTLGMSTDQTSSDLGELLRDLGQAWAQHGTIGLAGVVVRWGDTGRILIA